MKAAFMRGYERNTVRDDLRKRKRITRQGLRMIEHRIESALTARRTAKASTITNDQVERMMLEWSIIREELGV